MPRQPRRSSSATDTRTKARREPATCAEQETFPASGGQVRSVAAIGGRHEPLVGDNAAQRVNRAPQALLHQHRHAELLDRTRPVRSRCRTRLLLRS